MRCGNGGGQAFPSTAPFLPLSALCAVTLLFRYSQEASVAAGLPDAAAQQTHGASSNAHNDYTTSATPSDGTYSSFALFGAGDSAAGSLAGGAGYSGYSGFGRDPGDAQAAYHSGMPPGDDSGGGGVVWRTPNALYESADGQLGVVGSADGDGDGDGAYAGYASPDVAGGAGASATCAEYSAPAAYSGFC